MTVSDKMYVFSLQAVDLWEEHVQGCDMCIHGVAADDAIFPTREIIRVTEDMCETGRMLTEIVINVRKVNLLSVIK